MVFTSTRCVAEQTKGDKGENIATGCVKIVDFEKVGESEQFQEHRDGLSQNWEIWKI